MDYVSAPIAKRDGMGLALGRPAYTDDCQPPGKPLAVYVLRSPHASARIRGIDAGRARSVEGVACVLTYEDVPQVRFSAEGKPYPELCPYDRLILDRVVRYLGDAVAVVAAEDYKTAVRAAKLIRVDYERLTPVLDAERAQQGPRVHAEDGLTSPIDIRFEPERNVISSYRFETGKVEAVLPDCGTVVRETYRSQAQAHAMMETHRALTYLSLDGRLTVVSSTQCPFNVRRVMSSALELPEEMVRVVKPRVGGGFGGKTNVIAEFYPAIVTLKTGRPAKLIYSRQEAFLCTTRHASCFDVTLGAGRDGRVRAFDIHAVVDGGAYAEQSAAVLRVAGHKCLPLYNRTEAVRYWGSAVYTNHVPASALRGYGVTQSTFAVESAVNRLARELHMDPVELRLRNIIHEGERNAALEGPKDDGPVQIRSCALEQCILRGREMIGWAGKYPRSEKDGKIRAVGMAITMQGSGVAGIDTSGAMIKLNDSGAYVLLIGAADIGTGSDTILAQIAAEVLRVPAERIVVISGDTDLTPYDKGAYASCTTYITGNAVQRAAQSLRAKVIGAAADMWGISPDEVRCHGETLTAVGGRACALRELACWSAKNPGSSGMLAAAELFKGIFSPPPYVAGFAEVEVDCETGKVSLLDFCAVVDCGTVVNPKLARIQAEGGLVQGIGFALFEDVQCGGDGKLWTDSFMQYKIPTRRDVGSVRVEFIPSWEPTGPFGAKSIGEVVTNTPAPAIAGAVYNAIGVQIRSLPITPEKVLRAIRTQKPVD